MSGPMRYSRVPNGTSMQNHRWQWKIKPSSVGGPIGERLLCTADIPKIRKFLRTDMAFAEIAVAMEVSVPTLRSFVKRRSICNLKDRRNFISLQKSLAKEHA